MFFSVSFVRMPPLNWGGDSDYFYRATYGPAIRSADGLQWAVFGHVLRVTEERPRFTHGLVFGWDSRDAWEGAKRRAAGMPPLPRAAQGLETYAGEFVEALPAAAPAASGVFGAWLFTPLPDAPADALATYAAQLRQLEGVRGVWTAKGVSVEGGDAPKARTGVLLAEFASLEDAERSLRAAVPAPARPITAWATDVEVIVWECTPIP